MTLTEFRRFADENDIVPVSKEIYSKMISDSIKYAKVKQIVNSNPDYIHHTDMDTYKVNSIREVVEDGSENNHNASNT